MGARKGVGLERLGIVSSLLVLLIWLGIQAASRSVPTRNTWLWASSGQGQTFGLFLVLGTVLILLFSVRGILNKRLRVGWREPSADESDGESLSGPDGSENERN